MTVPHRERERRDWTLIVFLIPLGIILIIIVGQLAIHMFPNWVINADMRSNLDPNSAPGQPASLLQPLLPQILTPMAWAENYLTPGAGGDVSFPPFIVLEPTNTPTATPPSPSPTNTPSPISTTPSPTTTFVTTSTPKPTDDDNDDNTPPLTSTSTATSTATTTATATSTADPTGYPSTPDSSWTYITPAPTEINTDVPDGNIPSNIAELPNGSFTVLDISGNPLNVGMTPDNNYDLVFYENQEAAGFIRLDRIIIGISKFADGQIYYEVFNWGNGIPDTNTNVDTNILPPDNSTTNCDTDPECDNRIIPTSELYDPDDDGPAPPTGILIDVDTAPSSPPPGNYNYIVIISPVDTGPEKDPSQIDAIVVTEVEIPTPTP